MLNLLRTRRWQAFTAAAVLAILAFGLLSLWQWHRAEQKRAEFTTIATALAQTPVAAAAVTAPADWQAVTAAGTYDPDRQYLVRNQPQDGANGFWVLSLLRTDTGPDLWVVRGWTPADLAQGLQQQPPAPPTGPVTVTGYARRTEPGPLRAGPDLPAAQVSRVTVAELDDTAGSTTADWFVIAQRDPALAPVPPPQPTDSRNVSYAGQWLLFAVITIGGWWFFLRREAKEDAATPEPDDVPVASGP